MTPQETVFLVIVVVTVAAFAGVLAGVSWMERDWARKKGR